MKSADHDLVIKINGDLARDSSLGAKMNAGYEYSNWYYVNNGHNFSLENQRICAQKTIDRLGLDVDTAVQVQNAVIHAYQVADRMLDVREVIQRVHLTASQAIQGQMLDEAIKPQPVSIPIPPTIYKSLLDRTSNPPHGLLVPEKEINLSNQSLQGSDVGMLVQNLQYQRLELNRFDISHNNIGYGGVENIFYTFRENSPHFKSIITINVSCNNLDDSAAWYISESLMSARHPHLKGLDFHGNKLTGSGYTYIAKAMENPNSPEVAVTLEVHAEQRTAWEFVKHAAKYIFNEHYKSQQSSHGAQIALYGEKDSGHCIQALKTASFGISAGMIKELGKPETIKLIQNINTKSKNPTPKILVGVGVFINGIKDAAKGGDLITSDLLKCIGRSTPTTTADEFVVEVIGEDIVETW